MANNYDRIFKENIESLLLPLLKKVLGLIPPKLVPIDAKMQLLILSRLRKMEIIVKTQVEAVTIHYDIETDGLYLQGIEKGIQEGIEKGIEKGIEEGAALKERQVILAQWSLQEFSLERIALMSGAALERVTQVILAHLQAEGLSEVEAEQSLEAYCAKFI